MYISIILSHRCISTCMRLFIVALFVRTKNGLNCDVQKNGPGSINDGTICNCTSEHERSPCTDMGRIIGHIGKWKKDDVE